MKKTIILLTFLLGVSVLFTACHPSTSDSPSGSVSAEAYAVSGETSPASDHSTDQTSSQTAKLPEYQPGSIKLEPQDQDDYQFERKYRTAYYQISGEFSELLSEKERQDYMTWVENQSKQNGYGELRDEMLLVSFIKRYNISREEFDQAVEKMKAEQGPDENGIVYEESEVPNGDIIYTFDNEIINRYYRYE